MVEGRDYSFAKEVSGGQALVSRWAKEPEKPEYSGEVQQSHALKSSPHKPPFKDHRVHSGPKDSPSATKLESRWAKADAAPLPRQERAQSSRRAGGGSQSKGSEGTNSWGLQSSEDKWRHVTSSNSRTDQNRPQRGQQQNRQHSRTQLHQEHQDDRYSKGRGNHHSNQDEHQHQQYQSHKSHNVTAKDHKPKGNRLAEHLGLSTQPPTKSHAKSIRAGKSRSDTTAASAAPASDPGASVWSLEGYEPGEDWAAAEEEAFKI